MLGTAGVEVGGGGDGADFREDAFLKTTLGTKAKRKILDDNKACQFLITVDTFTLYRHPDGMLT